MISHLQARMRQSRQTLRRFIPGLALASLVAMSAQFVAEHSKAPVMLMALLFGMAISFVHETDTKVHEGIDFAAKSILKMGIVLLGARMSSDLVLALGWQTFGLVVFALLATCAFGLIVGRLLGLDRAFALLTAGAVSICGASAALAISAVLPKSENAEKHLFVTIIGVTTLSTIAMILYPALLAQLGTDDALAGRIIGATIHDVAQVVGAGFSISDSAGDTATLVKLIRVSLLAPTVIILALLLRHQQASAMPQSSARPPIIPFFVIGFFALAIINSCDLIPEAWQVSIALISKSALVTAIAAVGIKSNLKEITSIGYAPILLLVLETLFIAIFASTGFVLADRLN